MTRILIIQGHPDAAHAHFCHALGEEYAKSARASGHDVEQIDLGKIDVPLLTSKAEWTDSPQHDFIPQAQQAIEQAGHIVFIYPLWLGGMPALVKAWLEQVLRHDFAFNMDDKGWHARLGGRSARIIVTMGMPSAAYRWFYFAHSLRSFERQILRFCGIKPVRWSVFGGVEDPFGKRQKAYLQQAAQDGAAAR